MTPLEKDALLYAKTDKTEKLTNCLNAGASPGLADERGDSLLMHAAWRGHLPVVRELLRRGADANRIGSEKSNALSLARRADHMEVAGLLHEHTSLPYGDELTLGGHPCPCCGYLTLSSPPGSEFICQFCFWQDEECQLVFPEAEGGANRPSLITAQKNFISFGACEDESRQHVLTPLKCSRRDPEWRTLDVIRDRHLSEANEADHLRWRSVMHSGVCLYYWRKDYWLRLDRIATE